MLGGMICAVVGEIEREASVRESEERACAARIAQGVPAEQALGDMRSARDARYERDRKFAEEMQRLTRIEDRPGIDPLYLAAAFAFGMAIG